jgi:hypothetical protein
VKQAQALVNATLRAQFGRCEQIRSAEMAIGIKLHGGEQARCLEDAANRGESISAAMRLCSEAPTVLHTPDGGTGVRVNLVQDALAAMGTSTETQTFARSLLGEITLAAGDQGGLTTAHERPQAALLARFERHKADAGRIARARGELQATGRVSDATLRGLAVPGQVLPSCTLDALAAMQQDPGRYETVRLGALSTPLALARLQMECHELEDALAACAQTTREAL